MGILNVTPDSFADGGRYNNVDLALKQAHAMIASGADIIDIGGEATNPRSHPISLQEEADRVLPIIERLRGESNICISVDTSQPTIMREAIRLGANIINDVRALQLPKALETVAELNALVILMHMQGTPETMQQNPQYENVVDEVKNFLQSRVTVAIASGIKPENIILDPGIGFGKKLEHNLALLNHLNELVSLGYPLLLGASRKAMLGEILNKPPNERLAGSLALVAHTYLHVDIFRVHDVAETRDVLLVLNALFN